MSKEIVERFHQTKRAFLDACNEAKRSGYRIQNSNLTSVSNMFISETGEVQKRAAVTKPATTARFIGDAKREEPALSEDKEDISEKDNV